MGVKKTKWDLKDRMFSEKNMSKQVRKAATEKNLSQALAALDFAIEKHDGQTRIGKAKVPYIYHPLMMACHALSLDLGEDEIIATALLHDILEDCDVDVSQLPVGDEVKAAVTILTKSDEIPKDEYYNRISTNRIATIVKVLDRCNNISTMTVGFSDEKMVEYIDETEKYVYPILNTMKHQYPECYNAAFILKYHMKSVIESLKRLV